MKSLNFESKSQKRCSTIRKTSRDRTCKLFIGCEI